jgi:hypothetical protein
VSWLSVVAPNLTIEMHTVNHSSRKDRHHPRPASCFDDSTPHLTRPPVC